MKKIKELFRRLIASNRFLKLFSLVLAFFVWLIIVYATDDEYKRTIQNVPVTYTSTNTLSSQDLSVISIEPQTVDVEVVGMRYVVRGLGPQDIRVSLQLGSITSAGVQQVPMVDETESTEFSVKSIAPAQASVRVDRIDTKILEVQANVTGVNIADGYIKNDEIVSPERVTVTGPISDLNKVAHAIVNVNLDKTLSGNESVNAPIILRDADGKEITNDHITMDYDTAEVTVPVLKKKDVGVEIKFTHVPPYFPLDDLSYTFSNDTIEVAGPATLVDSYNMITLGYVDVNRLSIGQRMVFDVELPSGFTNVNNIQSVSVSFDTEEFSTRTFDIAEVEVVNAPSNYEVTVNAGSLPLRGVEMIGPRDVLESMTGEDLVAQIDLSGQERELATGQTRMSVTVFAPTKGTVWAYGDYVAIVDIAEK